MEKIKEQEGKKHWIDSPESYIWKEEPTHNNSRKQEAETGREKKSQTRKCIRRILPTVLKISTNPQRKIQNLQNGQTI